MNFRTAYCKSEPVYCPSGSRFRPKYCRKDGELVQVGVEDVYDSIQKAANGRLVEDLLRRASAGDASAIPPPVDSYVDVSKAPKDLLEAHSMLQGIKSEFSSLSPDIRKKFDNNFDTFLKASLDGSAYDLLAAKAEDSSPAPSAIPLSSDELSKIRSIIGGTTDA